MAILLRLRARTRTRTRTRTEPSPTLFFSTNSNSGSNSNFPFSSLFEDIKAGLKNPQTSNPNFSLRAPHAASTHEIQKNLTEFCSRTAAPPPSGAPPPQNSFQELYNELLQKRAIFQSLKSIKAKKPTTPRLIGCTAALPESVFGREMRRDSSATTTATTAMAFLKTYGVEDLGKKLRMLRPEGKGKDWFSVRELSERLVRLRKMEEEQTRSTTRDVVGDSGIYDTLRGCLTEQTLSMCIGENWEPMDSGTERGKAMSFWDEKFNHSFHICQTDLLDGDKGDLEKMSPFTVAKVVESLVNRLSALSLINEDKIRGLVRKIKLQGNQIITLEENVDKGKVDLKWVITERDKLLEGRHVFEEEKKTWATEKAAMKRELEETRLARDKNVDAVHVFESDLSSVKAEIEILQADLQATKMEAMKKFVEGFDAATTQVKFLHPDLDLGSLDYFKEIVNGELSTLETSTISRKL